MDERLSQNLVASMIENEEKTRNGKKENSVKNVEKEYIIVELTFFKKELDEDELYEVEGAVGKMIQEHSNILPIKIPDEKMKLRMIRTKKGYSDNIKFKSKHVPIFVYEFWFFPF